MVWNTWTSVSEKISLRFTRGITDLSKCVRSSVNTGKSLSRCMAPQVFRWAAFF